jgi:two-component system chemotaxis sensor kinase CheA
MPIDLSKFKDIYVSEVEDHIQKLNDNTLLLEKNATDMKLVEELMRSAHTIKGSSATMQYEKIAFLTHVLEDVFDYARSGVLKITPEIITVIFSAVDSLDKALKDIKDNKPEPDLNGIATELKRVTGVATEGVGKSARTNDGKPVVAKETLEKKQAAAAALTEKQAGEDLQVGAMTYIKIPVKRLDVLMDLMEELLVDKMRLEDVKKITPQIEGVVNHLSRLISELQFQVMQVRLVPVDQVFVRYPRMVRDLSVSQGKDVEFELTGGDIELDRTIVDKLGEPILHLLRNAVDHGIDKKGSLKLKATREKEFAVITLEQEGLNIDWRKLIEKSANKGIITAEVAERMLQSPVWEHGETPKHDVVNLLFKGVSTNAQVTETSGRGVGMIIVKNFVDTIGGRIMVESPIQGGGARFILELPFTLAIIEALLVNINGVKIAVPFTSISRSVYVQKEGIKKMADQEVAIIDGIDVPLVRLHNLSNTNTESMTSGAKTETVVLVKRGTTIVGIVVDSLIGKQEIIVKPLSSVLRNIKGFSGSTLLGDGQTILILDTMSIIENYKLIKNSN